jgi:hypothetical protein
MGSIRKTFFSVVLLNIMLFFALISIHEISHVFVGYCLGCEVQKAVLFDNTFGGPHTELLCSNGLNELLVYLGGLGITAAFSLSFLFSEIREKNLSLISLGISVILSSLDMSMLFSSSVFYPLLTSGFLLITAGEYLVGSLYFKEDIYFGFLNSKVLED